MGGKSRKTGGVSQALINRLVSSGGAKAVKADTSAPAFATVKEPAVKAAPSPKPPKPAPVPKPSAPAKAAPAPKPTAPKPGMFNFR